MSQAKNPYIVAPKPCDPYDVPLPESVEDNLDAKQRAKITKIRLEHAQTVTGSLSSAYGEILNVVGEDTKKSS